MKKIIYIFSFLFVMLLTSCEVEESQSNYPKTIQARNAFNYVENSIHQSVILLDLMTKISYYSEAANDKKEGIKNYFISSYSIDSTANCWILKNDYQEITFTHNNKSINETDAIWTAKISINLWDGTTQTSVEDKNCKVQCIGDKSWKINTLDFAFYGYYQNGFTASADLNVAGIDAYEKLESIYDFKVKTGSGITKIDNAKLTYNVLQPTTYTNSNKSQGLIIKDGEIEVSIDNESDKINAEIISSDYYYPTVKITYKGITETY